MPIPSKRKNEDKDTFISRCMSSSVMKSEFPDNKQRLAVCQNRLRMKNKAKGWIEKFMKYWTD